MAALQSSRAEANTPSDSDKDRQGCAAGCIDPDVVSQNLVFVAAETENGNSTVGTSHYIASVWCRSADYIIGRAANPNTITGAIRALID